MSHAHKEQQPRIELALTTGDKQAVLVVRLIRKQWIVVQGQPHSLGLEGFKAEVARAERTQAELARGVYVASWIDNSGQHSRLRQGFAIMYRRVKLTAWYDGAHKRHEITGETTTFGRGQRPRFKSATQAAAFARQLAGPQPKPAQVKKPTLVLHNGQPAPDSGLPFELPGGWPLWALVGGSLSALDLTRRLAVVSPKE